MASRLTDNTVAHPNPLPQGERERTFIAAALRRSVGSQWTNSSPASLPRLRQLLDPARHRRPVSRGAKTLQQVHEAGVAADQDARLVLLDAGDDAQRGGFRRGL